MAGRGPSDRKSEGFLILKGSEINELCDHSNYFAQNGAHRVKMTRPYDAVSLWASFVASMSEVTDAMPWPAMSKAVP